MEFVNTDDNWSRLGLKGSVDNLGAERILKALEVIASVESKHYDDCNPASKARGRYQFMSKTRELIRKHRVVTSEDFPSGATREKRLEQDFAAIWLMGSPVKGRMVLDDVVEGRPGDALIMLAKEWAGLPLEDNRSAYHGVGNNAAHISFDTAVSRMTVPDKFA